MFRDQQDNVRPWVVTWFVVGCVFATTTFLVCLGFGLKSYERHQNLWDEDNKISINRIRISQQEQLIKVEQQKAEIRIVEAKGIAEAQRIINASLTDKYLQHEAISSQKALADSPNHTTVYIPSGQNGIPIVRTTDDK